MVVSDVSDEEAAMRCSTGRWMLGCSLTLSACVVLTAAACSKSGQEAAPAGGAQPAASGQPAADAAAVPAAPPGQPTGAAAQTPAGAAVASRPAPGQPAPGSPAPAAAPAPAPAPPPPPPPRTFTLAEGTVLAIRTNYTLSSETHAAGQTFEASLAEPIVKGDWVVAKEGAAVEGIVVASTKGGRVKGTAELQVAVTALTLSDGQRVGVETEMATAAAKSEKKKDVGKVAITTGAGAIIGAIAGGGKGAAIGAAVGGAGGTAVVLGTRGKPAEIPARSEVHFRVNKPVQITEKK